MVQILIRQPRAYTLGTGEWQLSQRTHLSDSTQTQYINSAGSRGTVFPRRTLESSGSKLKSPLNPLSLYRDKLGPPKSCFLTVVVD